MKGGSPLPFSLRSSTLLKQDTLQWNGMHSSDSGCETFCSFAVYLLGRKSLLQTNLKTDSLNRASPMLHLQMRGEVFRVNHI